MKIVKHKNERWPNGGIKTENHCDLSKNRNVIIQVQAQNYENIFYSITHSNTPQELYTV